MSHRLAVIGLGKMGLPVATFYAALPTAAALTQRSALARGAGWTVLAPATAVAEYVVRTNPENFGIATKARTITRSPLGGRRRR